MKIVVIDYGLGNVQSIKNALFLCGASEVLLSCKPQEVLSADGIILPGVGAFPQGMRELKARGLVDVLHTYVDSKKPLLGICLGMQLLFDRGEEFGKTSGLGLVKGVVERFTEKLNDKLPHIGWNEIQKRDISWSSGLLRGVCNKEDVYFVHSYICKPSHPEIILSTTEYGGVEFCSSINQDNIYACQFHPEKSGNVGLGIVKNYIEIVQRGV